MFLQRRLNAIRLTLGEEISFILGQAAAGGFSFLQTGIDLTSHLSLRNIPDLADIPACLAAYSGQILWLIQTKIEKINDFLVLFLQTHDRPSQILLTRQIMHLIRAVIKIVKIIAAHDLPKGGIVHPFREDQIHISSVLNFQFQRHIAA